MELTSNKRPTFGIDESDQVPKKVKIERVDTKRSIQELDGKSITIPPEESIVNCSNELELRRRNLEKLRVKFPLHVGMMENLGPCSYFPTQHGVVQQHKTYTALYNWILRCRDNYTSEKVRSIEQ